MKLLIATGGSGGHIFPALQAALCLKERGHDILFAGSLTIAQEKIKSHGFATMVIPASGLVNRSPLGVLRFIGIMTLAIFKAVGVIIQFRPHKVVGFGGYGSFPIIFAAKLLGVPSLIHEQNVVPGKANALMAKMAKKIAISFKDSQKRFPENKVIWTGCPCYHRTTAKSKAQIYSELGLLEGRRVIVLLGGSQGSQKLNEVFFDFMDKYSNELNLQGIHMTGKKEYALYKDKYSRAGLSVKPFEFIHNIEDVYAAADVVVARSGASTVTEIGLLGIPSVLVPYPFAEDHQKYNAQVLSQCGAAILLEQKNLTVDSLKKSLENILNGNCTRDTITAKTKDLFSLRAAEDLAGAIEEF